MIKITGTMIHYYHYCKRKCWLSSNRINLEDNSEDVRIGKVLHELMAEKNKTNTEIKLDNIVIDKLTRDYLVEVKKSDSDREAVKWQVLLYLQKLKSKGMLKKGKIEYIEKRDKTKSKIEIIELTQDLEKELNLVLLDIQKLINLDKPPIEILEKKCKKCAYYEYCFI